MVALNPRRRLMLFAGSGMSFASNSSVASAICKSVEVILRVFRPKRSGVLPRAMRSSRLEGNLAPPRDDRCLLDDEAAALISLGVINMGARSVNKLDSPLLRWNGASMACVMAST